MTLQGSFGWISALAMGGILVSGLGCSSSAGEPTVPPPTKLQGVDSGRVGADPSVNDAGVSERDSSARKPDGASAGDAPEESPPLACPPADTTHYVPPAYVPATAHQGACTTDDIEAFVVACAGGQDSGTACDDWRKANVAAAGGTGTACGACIVAPANNGATWTDPGGHVSPNYAGCMQIVDPDHGPGCAAAYNNATDCSAIACDYCPTPDASTDIPGVNASVACNSAATLGKCNSYNAALVACNTDFQLDGGAFFTCSPDEGDAGDWTYITTLICGGASDAGEGAD